MTDAVLVATILAFFFVVALLAWACSRITDSALADGEPEEEASVHDPRQPA